MPERYLKFPEGFIWGAAVSAYQIEGVVGENRRSDFIWDFKDSPACFSRIIQCNGVERI